MEFKELFSQPGSFCIFEHSCRLPQAAVFGAECDKVPDRDLARINSQIL